MRLLSEKEMPNKKHRTISSLSVDDVNKIVYMDSIGVTRKLIALSYNIRYKELLKILPSIR